MQEKLKVDKVIDRYEGDKANLISILHSGCAYLHCSKIESSSNRCI